MAYSVTLIDTEGASTTFDCGPDEYILDKAEEEGVNWGRVFAENMQGVLDRMLNGEETAFSQFVKQETDRVLITTGALVAPGFPILADNGQGLP